MHVRGGPIGKGLAEAAGETIDAADAGHSRIGPATFRAVADAIARLVKRTQRGQFSAVSHTEVYALLYEPLDNSFVYAAQLIQPLVSAGLYSAATLPKATGVVLSLGGGILKIAVGREPSAGFLFRDSYDVYHFQLGSSSALVLRNPDAVVRLNFGPQARPGGRARASGAKTK